MAGTNIARLELAMKRIRNVLRTHGAASARILENKISDAGPTNQRIDPHLLTKARVLLENVNDVEVVKDTKGTPWYYLRGIPAEVLEPRLKELQALHERRGRSSSRCEWDKRWKLQFPRHCSVRNTFTLSDISRI